MISLNVPYLSQLDNTLNPYGSCNVTSVAMVLGFYGSLPLRDPSTQEQLEDRLYNWLIDKRMSRHSPYDLSALLQVYRPASTFTNKAKWNEVRAHLDSKNPCIVHGYFTRFGHIVVIVGYNDHGFVCHDPYGEYPYRNESYLNNGRGIVYSYDLMRELCSPDGDLWIHFCR